VTLFLGIPHVEGGAVGVCKAELIPDIPGGAMSNIGRELPPIEVVPEVEPEAVPEPVPERQSDPVPA
jgi:hypothetical protein